MVCKQLEESITSYFCFRVRRFVALIHARKMTPFDIFLSLIFVILIVFILWFVLRADADLTLLFFERFGRKLDLTGKVVWITGASSGIGEYLAYDCVRIGARLAISGVNTEKLENVKRNCLSIRPEADVLMVPFLIQDFSVHQDCFEKVIQHFGHIDVLVNNAGVSQKANFPDIASIEVDRNLFDVNVFGTVNLTRIVLRHFLERGSGQFVVTSSMAGKVGAPFSCSYTGSKHALHGYFECMRMEMSRKNISVCITCPGPVFSNLRSRCVAENVNETYCEDQPPTAKKMRTDRCSHLIAVSMVNKLGETWICQQPLLLLYYASQYLPTLFKSIFVGYLFDPAKANKFRSGSK